MDGPLLAALFRQARPAAGEDSEIGPWIAEIVWAARARWPAVQLEDDAFVHFLAERVEALSIGADRGADLFIACACAHGDAKAVATFEAAFFPDVPRALARLRLDAAGLEEAAQQLRCELFVSERGKRPKIAEYGGRGDLRGWLRVFAIRSTLKLLRRQARHAPNEDEQLLERLPARDDEPELAYLKQLYRPAFKQAFQEALDSLPARDQNLLRQHLVDGLSIDQLGALHQVHRATAARWIASAKDELLKRTRERFMRCVRVSREECESILRLVHSQLDATIRRRLAAAGG